MVAGHRHRLGSKIESERFGGKAVKPKKKSGSTHGAGEIPEAGCAWSKFLLSHRRDLSLSISLTGVWRYDYIVGWIDPASRQVK